MKKIFWISIIILSILIPISLSIIIPILLNKFIWTPLIIVISVQLIIGIILGIIILIVKLTKKSIIPEETNVTDAKVRARIESLTDEDDPDNFMILNHLIYKIGEKGTEKTPILILKGWGSETNKPRTALINLKLPDKETSWIKGENAKDDEYIKSWAIKMAESQPQEEIEKITTGYQFGMPVMTKETIKQAPIQTKEEKEKEQAEERNIV